jgi:hypothetical protein
MRMMESICVLSRMVFIVSYSFHSLYIYPLYSIPFILSLLSLLFYPSFKHSFHSLFLSVQFSIPFSATFHSILRPFSSPSVSSISITNPAQSHQSQQHIDAKLEIMASSLSQISIQDPLLEQKEKLIHDLEDENLSLKLELESLRVGFRDGSPPFPVSRFPVSPFPRSRPFYPVLGSGIAVLSFLFVMGTGSCFVMDMGSCFVMDIGPCFVMDRDSCVVEIDS